MPDTCPQCGTLEVIGYDTCHTWPSGPDNTKWMSCMGCGSAFHLYCSNDDCDWSYDWGLNPMSPYADSNEECRPQWLDYKFEGALPLGWVWPYSCGVAAPLNSPYWDDCTDSIRNQIIEWRAEDAD